MSIRSKLPEVETTIFTVMTRIAQENNAINLSQGFPDFDCDPELIALVDKHMRAGRNQYAPMQGVPILRERIAEKTEKLYNATYDPETEITISSGATEALFAVITATVHPGDEVILLEPAYDSYRPVIMLNGGVPVHIKLKFPDYHIDWDEVNRAITPRTRLLIINTPHNPTGSILDESDMQALHRIIEHNDLLLLSDEVYEHVIFDGHRHESLARYPALAERAFVVSSFGKTYHATGWKLGYCLAPQPLTAEFRKVHQFLTFASNTPMQYAYADYMLKRKKYLQLPQFYQERRDKFLTLIRESRFRVIPCKGTYFQMLDYSEISNESDFAFARRLAAVYGVAAIPPSVFYHDREDNKVLRFCFAKKDETLEQAAERLCKI